MTCVAWSLDDLKLVSCADNGSLYEWNVATGERVHEVRYLAEGQDCTHVTLVHEVSQWKVATGVNGSMK